jgi:bacterioferritin-associated ferredoxin
MTGCGSGCGSCVELAEQVLRDARATAFPLPLHAAA